MYDFSKEISKFHEDHVRLTRDQQHDMKRRRDTNRDRVVSGLKDQEKASVVEWISQGGYAMKTMTQPPELDAETRYDIDMGVVFEEGDTKTPKTTKGWVRDAIASKATNLKNPPEAKPKCVRVVYADGYQCDFPVFQRQSDGDDYTYEIAIGDNWTASDPKSMNTWFDDEVVEKSPEQEGHYQLRRIVRFIKYFSKVHAHRRDRKFPAGLVATALAVEAYQSVEGRDDEALYKTFRVLSTRSEYSPVFANGVMVSDDKDIDRIRRMVEEANSAVEALDKISDDQEDVTDTDARKAWKKVFRHSFFDQEVAETASAKMEYKSALGTGGLAAPAIISSSAVADLSAEEKARRAEAAVQSIRGSARDSKPWST